MTTDGPMEPGWHDRTRPDEAQVERALVVRRQPESAITVFERMTALPALAWEQPAVRSIVKTGVGAAALALAARAAQRWLAGTPRGRGARASLLPAIGEALGSPPHEPRAQRARGPDEDALVVETFIYARRVIHR